MTANHLTAEAHGHLAEYNRRMNRVLDHIDRNLDGKLDLALLADVAHFSRFHFHRLFVAWMGETVGDYAQRRRLETAAMRLSCTRVSVLEIALSTGFGSGEALAHAFKRKYGLSPSAWRTGAESRRQQALAQWRAGRQSYGSNPDQLVRKPDQVTMAGIDDHMPSLQPESEMHMDVIMTTLPRVRVAYHRYIGCYGPQVNAYWREVVAPWIGAHGLDDPICYGIGRDDPAVTPADKCRYDACVTVPETFLPGGQTGVYDLPGGRYAVARFKGDALALGDAWMQLMREWLPASGLQCDERPVFERFTPSSGQDPVTGEFCCELCLPVRPL
ncbi:AraC family transcriptional regulator [Parachitinimonas caeni]|uniref:GyrI-like domain-containing protein n=1 Tax=Parachitinimonas caeni TaxID=3031301 RepID=A0ABT7DV35_9NEIS|nr:GyrI-like domain-containing protein [Parachitinimonas caeni]MDK2123930.1 GyrI-like domain-containing protein [Parachitinimonas caeni]